MMETDAELRHNIKVLKHGYATRIMLASSVDYRLTSKGLAFAASVLGIHIEEAR